MARRVDCWYRCRDCHRRRKGGPGMLCCPECGGELDQIGYVSRVVQPTARTSKAKRWRAQ